MRGWRGVATALIVALCLSWTGWAGAFSLRFEVGRFSHPLFAFEGLVVRMGGAHGGAELHLAELAVAGARWRNLRLACKDFELEGTRLRCVGTIAADEVGSAALDLVFDLSRRAGRLRLDLGDGGTLEAALLADGRIAGDARRLALSRLRQWLPASAAWQPSGVLDARFASRPVRGGMQVEAAGRLSEGSFATADGLRAAERIDLEWRFSTRSKAGAAWQWEAALQWRGGEAYWHPWYVTAGPALEARGSFRAGVLDVEVASVALEGVRSLAASGRYDFGRRELQRAALALAHADLAVLGPTWLAPLLAPAQTGRVTFAGHASAGLSFADGRLAGAEIVLSDAGFSLSPDLAFGPVSGFVPWRADAPTQGRLEVAGGRWQKLQLGPFVIEPALEGMRLSVPRVEVPLLDSALRLEDLQLVRTEAGWVGRGAASMAPVSLALLTEATGLPRMEGRLSASVPALRVSPGELALDGALVISVFDGYLRATRLQVLEPFGVSSRLFADVDARHIDLAQLTRTFSFGRVTGFVDADITGLELVRWRPQSFDARLRSSPGDYPRRISQRAVQNISALGGAGAMAAIQRSLLGVFETFGYDEMGLGCRLVRRVCYMHGLEGLADDGAGRPFTIVRGGGIPALNVIGYNRRVDWQELIDRLQRVIASNTAPRIE